MKAAGLNLSPIAGMPRRERGQWWAFLRGWSPYLFKPFGAEQTNTLVINHRRRGIHPHRYPAQEGISAYAQTESYVAGSEEMDLLV